MSRGTETGRATNARNYAHVVGPMRRILSGLHRRESVYLVAITLLQAAESLGVVVAVYVFALDSRTLAFGLTAGLAALFAARRVLIALLTRRVRLRLIEQSMSAVLGTEMTRGSLLRDEDAMLAIFEGLHVAERVTIDAVPGLAASLLASTILGLVISRKVPNDRLLIGVLAITVGAGAMLVSRQIISRFATAAALASRRVFEAIASGVNGRIDLVANGRDAAFMASLKEDAKRWCDLALRADRVSALAGRAPVLAAALAVAAVVALDASLRGDMLATGIARSAVYASAVPPFLAVARYAMQLAKDNVKLRPLMELLAADRSPAGGPPGTPLPSLPARVEWRGVSVRYGDAGTESLLALDDVSIVWAEGKALLVVGPNGSGKSTLLRLLLGLFTPATGSVVVNGLEVESLDLTAWRTQAAYLGQRPYILDRATIRETIAAMVPTATDVRMQRALERLAVWSALVRKLPNDPLSACVGTLSVGQRQRVALARVLVQDTNLIVLDEPDANLDAAGVAIVADLVRELSRDRMVIVAAHTPELAAAGDVVVELEMGRVRSITHRDLDTDRRDHA